MSDANAAEPQGSAPVATRPKLNLAPRSANPSASAPAGGSSGKPNPFGGAVPREAVIAGRTGVNESDVLKKEAQAAAVRLRLSSEQQEQKKTKELEVADAKKALTEAKELGDETIARTAATKCAEAEAALAELMQSFEALAVQLAHEGGKRPSELRRVEDNNAAYGGQGQRSGGGGPYAPSGQGGRGGGGGYDRGGGGYNRDEGRAEEFKNFGGSRRGGQGGEGGAADYGGAFGGRRGGQGGESYGGGGGHSGYQERD